MTEKIFEHLVSTEDGRCGCSDDIDLALRIAVRALSKIETLEKEMRKQTGETHVIGWACADIALTEIARVLGVSDAE